ncbi:GAP1-N1 domain-containing protein [Paraburkholderia sp. RL17-347-BIC-D]|uniref:GAP1-N1 domain-containing protein n=1 Tax=Paraburkholderia sp. RL17-347-BIC-D TaxID=3031632 RepID=UPI0038B76F60
MTGFDQQLHGYRQGHQLLSSTIRLPKPDQDLIDRLSDVAGPLSPGERFSPYLTLYPLPSETHYVVARTWQDLEAPRAGCVRTRSVLVPMSEWQELQDIASIVAVATEAGSDNPAERRASAAVASLLPPIEPSHGIELIEALFLEERAPIVVFDAEAPEPLALRLTTALWPGFRRTFSMSTFARSPRTIGRKSFDLVFASKEARARFADWKGRRIDGRKREQARHPWSAPIVDKILSAPVPSLKSLDALGEMSSDGVGSESALRVSMLWDDLRRKLPKSPTAALGMLDIANTRRVRQVDLIRELEPALARSAAMAATTMQAEDAWRFLGALIQKLEGLLPTLSLEKPIRDAAVDLASRHPIETLDVISALNLEPQKALLVSAAADGLSRSLNVDVAQMLSRLDAKNLLDLMFASASLAKGTLGRYPIFSSALAAALRTADDCVRAEAIRLLLGLLVDDCQVEPARMLINDLDADGLVKEARHLHAVNGLSSTEIRGVLVERARALRADAVFRDAVSEMGASAGRDALLEAMLRPIPADMDWLVTSPALKDSRRNELIRFLLAEANLLELRGMLADQRMLTRSIALLNASDESDAELLTRIVCNVAMPSRDYVTLVVALLPTLKVGTSTELVNKAIELALPQEPNEVSSAILDRLLSAAGDKLNGVRAMRAGLQRGVSSAAASRNLMAFGRAPNAARRPMFNGVEEMANALAGRRQLDISKEAAEIVANLLWESGSVTANGFMRASATLLPIALDEKREVASPLIAAAFPPVYRELTKDSALALLSLMFVFLDWDKCKSARRRLVDAYFQSEWRISDIAIAAARAGDPVRILGRIAREQGGKRVLRDLGDNLKHVPDEVRELIRAALKELGLS